MESQTGSCGSRNLFYTLFVVFVSYKFAKWDFESIYEFSSSLEFKILNLWKLASVLTLSCGWFGFVIVLLILVWEKESFLKYIGLFLLVNFGPNLLIWTCIGFAINGFNLRDFRSSADKYRLHPVALIIKIFVWGSLFSISILCSLKLFFIAKEHLNKVIMRNNIKKCRKFKCYPHLIGENCSICLETFADNDLICELKCDHKFHPSCIQSWILEKGTCPMCRSIVPI